MPVPELVVVTGCNAAGKSSFIRSRISQLKDFEVIMTDVYKGRTREMFKASIRNGKNIILETVFSNAEFKNWIDEAKVAGYYCTLINLFLDSPIHSIERVGHRAVEQNGLVISGENVRYNFNENFKNVATYFLYFDRSNFIYTGNTGHNEIVMCFTGSELVSIKATDLQYPKNSLNIPLDTAG